MGGYWENKNFALSVFGLTTKNIIFVSLCDCSKTNIILSWDQFVFGLWTKILGKKLGRKLVFLSQDNNLPIFGKQVRAHFWKTHHSWRHCFTSLTFENVVLWPFFTLSRHDFFLSYDKIFFVSRGFWLTTGHNTLTPRPGTLLTEHCLLYVHCWTFWEL